GLLRLHRRGRRRQLRLPRSRRRDPDSRPSRRRPVGDHRREALHDQRHRLGQEGWQLYTVVCRPDPGAGADDELAAIAVPGATPGITIVDIYDKIGHRGVVTPRVHFDGVRVPAANLIGEPGKVGKRIVAGAFSWTAALIGAACVGTMRAAFEYALDFTRIDKRLRTVPVIDPHNVRPLPA